MGGVGMYFAHVLMSVNETTEIASSNGNPNSNGGTSDVGFRLDHASFFYTHTNYPSFDSLEDPSLYENSFQLRLAVYLHVAGLSPQELIAGLKTITNEKEELSRHVREELQRALIERLAIENPKAATDFVVEQFEPISNQSELKHLQRYLNVEEDKSMPMVKTVFRDWAITELQSAVDRAKNLAGNTKHNALIGILDALSGQSLNIYRQIAQELGDEEQGTDAYLLSLATNRVNDFSNQTTITTFEH